MANEKLISSISTIERVLGMIYEAIELYPSEIEKLASHLIAHGVTVQEWISVKDRLPEIVGDYLVVVKYKYDFEKEYSHDTDVATYRFDGGYIDGCWDTYNDWDEGQQHLHVTHWMPMPEPPKET